MKTAIFFDGYAPFHETKDPGLIAVGLSRLGYVATLVTETKTELDGYEAQFPIITAKKRNFTDVDFWKQIDADVVICYTWLGRKYNSIVAAIRHSGKKVLLKADSDGRLGYPVIPRWQHQHLMATLPLRLRFKYLRLNGIIAQIETANAVLIESPKAYENVQRFLHYWKRPSLISKLHVVPNPVTDDIIASEISSKQNVLISVGRWNDPVKNILILLRSAKHFLESNSDWSMLVVGEGEKIPKQIVSKWESELRTRVKVLGEVPHPQMAKLLGESRIFFVPSKRESWGISAAEALCMGCSIVGTPLEPLDFLVGGGFSGTVAKGFAIEHLVRALAHDVSKHTQGTYNPFRIAGYWRPKLSIREVTSQICELLTKL
jgi:glycosyltransferase involved in cell wall biosynthesis